MFLIKAPDFRAAPILNPERMKIEEDTQNQHQIEDTDSEGKFSAERIFDSH